jgi:hypothetical protein
MSCAGALPCSQASCHLSPGRVTLKRTQQRMHLSLLMAITDMRIQSNTRRNAGAAHRSSCTTYGVLHSHMRTSGIRCMCTLHTTAVGCTSLATFRAAHHGMFVLYFAVVMVKPSLACRRSKPAHPTCSAYPRDYLMSCSCPCLPCR